MNYFVSKKTNRSEWRIYFENFDTGGQVLYKGRKEMISESELYDLLEFRLERSSGKFYFLNYEKLDKQPDIKDRQMWFMGNDVKDLIIKSWESLQSKLIKMNPDFKKIVVSKYTI